jgi:hypothetical protein
MSYKRKDVTPDLLSMAHHDTIQLEIRSKPYRVEMPNVALSPDGTLLVCDVRRLDSDTEGLLIVPAVFESVLKKYENPVGLAFELVNQPEREGKNYRNLKVYQLTEE